MALLACMGSLGTEALSARREVAARPQPPSWVWLLGRTPCVGQRSNVEGEAWQTQLLRNSLECLLQGRAALMLQRCVHGRNDQRELLVREAQVSALAQHSPSASQQMLAQRSGWGGVTAVHRPRKV